MRCRSTAISARVSRPKPACCKRRAASRTAEPPSVEGRRRLEKEGPHPATRQAALLGNASDGAEQIVVRGERRLFPRLHARLMAAELRERIGASGERAVAHLNGGLQL